MLRERHCSGIEPAVDHLRYTVHLLAADRALDRHRVDIRTVQLNILRTVIRHLLKLCNTSDRMLMTALTLPDIQRSSPVTVPADAPVLHVLKPVAEASLADALRDPVDGIVVGDQILLHIRHLDKPRLACIVDQRSITSPTVRIAMLKVRRVKEKPSRLQILKHLRICFLHE